MLATAARVGWRGAVERHVPASRQWQWLSSEPAAFLDLFPLARASRVLEIGCGAGARAAGLANEYELTVAEACPERAAWLRLRGRQEGWQSFRLLETGWRGAAESGEQYDGVIAMPAPDGTDFLARLASLLSPRGQACIGLRKRGWTHGGWNRLRRGLARAGLRMQTAWICPLGLERPAVMIPLQNFALGYARSHGMMGGGRKPAWAAPLLAQAWIARRAGDWIVSLRRMDS